MTRLHHAATILLPESTPRWLHYTGRVLLGLLSLPVLVVLIPAWWLVYRGGRFLHDRGERVVRAWRIMQQEER